MAMKKQNVLLNIVSFLNMGQAEDEAAKHFAARLKDQASLCNFLLPEGQRDYSEEMVKHQLVRGLQDPLIQEQVLAHSATEDKSMTFTKTLSLIEAKESGKQDAFALNKGPQGGLNRLSEYKSSQKKHLIESRNPVKQEGEKSKSEDKCGWCAKTGHGRQSEETERKKSCPAYGKICDKCGRSNHIAVACRSKVKPSSTDMTSGETGETVVGSVHGTGPFCKLSVQTDPKGCKVLVDHVIFSDGTWTKSKPEEHPSLEAKVTLIPEAYTSLNLPSPRVKDRTLPAACLPDTGAQITIAGLNIVRALGTGVNELSNVALSVSAANNTKMKILGGVFL